MGTFMKSFWREMGRNTGKRVSNAIYGDKWGTPIRVQRGSGGGTSSGGGCGCAGCLATPFKILGYILLFPFLILYWIFVLPIKWLIGKL